MPIFIQAAFRKCCPSLGESSHISEGNEDSSLTEAAYSRDSSL